MSYRKGGRNRVPQTGGLSNGKSLSIVLEAGSPGPKCQHGQYLVRSVFLAPDASSALPRPALEYLWREKERGRDSERGGRSDFIDGIEKGI